MITPPLKEQLRINCVISDLFLGQVWDVNIQKNEGHHHGDPGRDGAGGVPRKGARVLANLTGLI